MQFLLIVLVYIDVKDEFHNFYIYLGDLVWTIVKGPLEAVAGVMYGIVLGVLIWYFPHPKQVLM